MDALELRMRGTGYPIVGVSEPSLLLQWEEITSRFPDAQWILIERDPKESLAAFQKLFPEYPESFQVDLVRRMEDMTKFMSTECLHVPYAKLDDFNTCELIVQRCTGHGLNRERFRLLNSLNISQNVPKVMRELATVEVS